MSEGGNVVNFPTGIEARLAPFLAANPHSSVQSLTEPVKITAVKSPWGDDSIVIDLSSDTDKTVDALNAVILPERYSGIWHVDTGRLEVIFTAYPLPDIYDDLPKRRFVFRHDGQNYECSYDTSSARLLAIARNFVSTGPLTGAATLNRNLGSFRIYAEGDQQRTIGMRPLSFWIDGLIWDDAKVLEVVEHLNFYMSYFDAASPIVLIHAPRTEPVVQQFKPRYLFDTFPKEIRSHLIDDFLLQYWSAAKSTPDPSRRYLYFYQIIEQVSMTYIEDKVRKNIKRVLSSPQSIDDTEFSIEKIIEHFAESKLHDSQKIDHVLKDTVEHSILWKIVESNLQFFSRKTVFEGGFEVEALASSSWELSDFSVHGMMAVSNTLRQIRNALSHAKDQRSMTVITPTKANYAKLQPWTLLAEAAAGEIMVYAGRL
jgi:hypothetical protein